MDFHRRAWVGCSGGAWPWVLGRAELSTCPRGLWVALSPQVPAAALAAPQSQALAAASSSREANAARCHLPVCSGGRIHGAEGLRPPPTLPRTPRIVPRLVFLAPACKPCPASLRLAALPHRASPGPGERVRSSGGAWGVLEQTWPPGAKHAVGAGVRPLQMAAPQTLAWRSHGTVTSPQGPRREPHLPCDREGAIPTQNAPRMQVCPCPLQPKHQGTGRARMAAGSQIRAVSRQRRWPNNSGKRPRMWF